MYMVDVNRGRRDAAALSSELAEGTVVDIDVHGDDDSTDEQTVVNGPGSVI